MIFYINFKFADFFLYLYCKISFLAKFMTICPLYPIGLITNNGKLLLMQSDRSIKLYHVISKKSKYRNIISI